MPEYEPPHVDKKETIDEGHRLKMLELAIDGIEGLEIETIELERKGISYTYDTMKLLNERDPDTDYYFIIGADMVDYLPKWYRIDELVEMVQFVGVQRPRYKAGTSYPVIWSMFLLWTSLLAWCESLSPKVGRQTLCCQNQSWTTSRKKDCINDL